jgi:protein SCO1/2
MSRLVRWLSYGLIAVILLAGGVFLVDRPSDKGSDIGVSVPGGLSVGGKFTLIDEHGATVHDTTYRGRWMLLYFGYT